MLLTDIDQFIGYEMFDILNIIIDLLPMIFLQQMEGKKSLIVENIRKLIIHCPPK